LGRTNDGEYSLELSQPAHLQAVEPGCLDNPLVALPAERPTRFQLVANLKTAKLIGITLPSSILLRAD
jgi:hypothetical protein